MVISVQYIYVEVTKIMSEIDRGLHILLGISGNNDEVIKSLNAEFNKRGRDVEKCASKYQKFGVEQYLSEHSDVDVLIISEYLQQSNPYVIDDFDRLNDINGNVVIIPILNSERKGTSYVNELLSVGIYTALFQEDATITNIADMVLKGRTRKEARYYYGTESISEINSGSVNIHSCVEHISLGGERESTKERADYIRSKVSNKEFEDIISRLPNDVKERLKVYDDYSEFFEDTAPVSEKRTIFPNKLLKNIVPVQSEEVYVPSTVKQEVQSAVKKVIIGFAGTQDRIGTTHQAILFANYLNAAGYTVAVVESEHCECKSFHTLQSRYNMKAMGDCVSYRDVDYYPSFNLGELNRIFLKDYNFVLIDFGVYNESMALEFGRCVVQIIVSGSKSWETPMLERLLMLVDDEEILKKFNYLFLFTPEDEKKTIIKNMDVLDKVFFADYQPDPFVNDGYDAIKLMLEDYLPGENIVRRGQLLGRLLKLFE